MVNGGDWVKQCTLYITSVEIERTIWRGCPG